MDLKNRVCHIFMLCIIFNLQSNLYAQVKGVVIVNKKVPVDSISTKELEKIYLGKKSFWSNQIKIQPCQLPLGSDLGKKFTKNILKMTYKEFKRYWVKSVYSGASIPPMTLLTPEAIINYVSQNQGGIGFIPESKANPLENCKIIKIDDAFRF